MRGARRSLKSCAAARNQPLVDLTWATGRGERWLTRVDQMALRLSMKGHLPSPLRSAYRTCGCLYWDHSTYYVCKKGKSIKKIIWAFTWYLAVSWNMRRQKKPENTNTDECEGQLKPQKTVWPGESGISHNFDKCHQKELWLSFNLQNLQSYPWNDVQRGPQFWSCL